MGERRIIDVPGGPVEVEQHWGDPDLPPLVFLHEGLGSIDLWRGFPGDVRAALGGNRTLVFSRHGHGRSAPARLPRPVDYMHHEADVVLPALLDALGIERPMMIGHSDGASIALLHAGAGHAVAGIVCLAAHVFVEEVSVAGIEAVRRAFDSSDMAARMGRYHDDAAATFRGWNDVWLSDDFRSWNIEERLPAITAPVLVVQGTADEYGTVAQAEAVRRGVAGPCSVIVLDDIGHAPHLDARDRVLTAITEFAGR